MGHEVLAHSKNTLVMNPGADSFFAHGRTILIGEFKNGPLGGLCNVRCLLCIVSKGRYLPCTIQRNGHGVK